MLAQIWRKTLYYRAYAWISGRLTKRQMTTFVLVVFGLMFIGSAAAVAADGQTTPVGVGDFLIFPDLAQGNSKTLLESYPIDAWQLDSELSPQDWMQNIFYGLSQFLFFILKTLVYMAVGLVYWMFSFTKIDALSGTTASLIGGASTGLLTWLFPSAVAIGASVTYAMRQRDGAHSYSQLAWYVAAGVLAISLATGAQLWVSAVDNTRTVGMAAIATMSDPLINSTSNAPIPAPQTATFNGTSTDNLLRKSGDAVWRNLLVQPWCIANYGSVEACQRYGPDMLAMGGDTEKRKNDYIKKIIYNTDNPQNKPNESNKEAPTSQWVKGEKWADRLGIVALSIIVALAFCLLLLSLGFAALVALAMAYMLLIAGVFFAMLWIIPGRPRQWGVRWFDTLLGTILTSLMATLAFTIVMLLLTGVFAVTGQFGWASTVGLGLVLVTAAFKLRGTLSEITGAFAPNAARAAAIGYVGARLLSRGARSLGRGAMNVGRGVQRYGRVYGRDIKNGYRSDPYSGGTGRYGRGYGTDGPGGGGGGGGRSPYRPQVPQRPEAERPMPTRPGAGTGPGRRTTSRPEPSRRRNSAPVRQPVPQSPRPRTSVLPESPHRAPQPARQPARTAQPAFRPAKAPQPARQSTGGERPAFRPQAPQQPQTPTPRRSRGGQHGR